MELGALSNWSIAASRPLGEVAEIASTVAGVTAQQISLGALRHCLEARADAARVEDALASNEAEDRRRLGTAYQVLETDWDRLGSSIDWAAELRRLLGGPVTVASAERLVSVRLSRAELDAALDDWHRARGIVAANFVDARAAEVGSDLGTTFEDALDLLSHFATTIGDIDEWVEFQRARDALEQLKVGGVIDFCETAHVNASEVPLVVERACLERWADAVIDEDRGRLRHLRAD